MKQQTEIKFINARQGAIRYQMCYSTLKKHAENCGAWHKMGDKIVRIDVEKLDNYLASNK